MKRILICCGLALCFLLLPVVGRIRDANAQAVTPAPRSGGTDNCSGKDCSVLSLTSTGTVLGVDAGFTGSLTVGGVAVTPCTSCSVSALTSAGTVTSNSASGQDAFDVGVNGGRVRMGSGSNEYFSCTGSNACRSDAVYTFGGGIDLFNSSITDSYSGSLAVQINSSRGLRIRAQPLSASTTCAVGLEGNLLVDSASGANTGHATRLCMCRSNGSNTYAWINVVTQTVGTTTSCSD